MIDMKPKQLIKVFVKKTEPDGSISLDRYGTFDELNGLIEWLDRFSLKLADFKRTAEANRVSYVRAEKQGDVQYDLYIKLYDEVEGADYLNKFEAW